MLKYAPEKFKKEVLKIMNYCYENGKMMKDWKINHTIFIDKGDQEKIRPITMSSCVSKIMERIINERMMWWSEKKGIIDSWQNGFRRGRSCLDNIARVKMEVEIAARTGEKIIAAFLDVKSAYDNVNRDCLIENLREEKCPYKITRYIEEWMTDRITIFVVSEEKEKKYVVNKGLPQGGVLSPLLYAIYTKNITRKVNPQTKILQYADDIVVIVREENVNVLKIRLRTALIQIDSNLRKIGLQLEHGKTNMIAFQCGKSNIENFSLKIGCEKIQARENAKFLGIIFDRKMNFEEQIRNVSAKTNKSIDILRYLNRVAGVWKLILH